MEQSANANLFELQLDQPALNYLNESARWARFLSIVGFISCGLILIFGIFYGTLFSSMMRSVDAETASLGGGLFTTLYLFGAVMVAVLLFFPALFLFRFSSKMKKAYNNNDQVTLTDSLKNLKSFFKFYGIMTIIVLGLYALIFIAAIFGAMAGRH